MQMPVLRLEERTALDPEDFFQSFLLQNRPVIIRGAIAHWPAIQKWSPEYLRATVEGAKVVIQSKSDYGSSGSKRHFEESKEADFAEVVDMMTLNDAPDMSYVRQTRVWKKIEALVADVQPLRYGPANLAKTNGNLWIGLREQLPRCTGIPDTTCLHRFAGRRSGSWCRRQNRT
jgi:hypothetical protein